MNFNKTLIPVVLAGGAGSRLWPISKKSKPKQFNCLTNVEQSLLQSTIRRVKGVSTEDPIVICNDMHRFIAAEQLSKTEAKTKLLIEPIGRNTLPAITSSCVAAIKANSNPLVLVLPSDHSIENQKEFINSIKEAANRISENQIITFGIKPTRAETGFGYLKLEDSNATQPQINKNSLVGLSEFVEKPNFDLANSYFNSKQFMWNSGIFLARAMTFIELVRTYQKSAYDCCVKAYNNSVVDLDFIRLESSFYSNCPSISFDNGVMELLCSDPKRKVTPLVMPLDCGWDDLGAWDSIHRLNQRSYVHCSGNDSERNSILSDAVLLDASNCLVKSDSKLITMLGMKDTIVIDTRNALLVANMDRAQEVKELVSKLEKLGKEIALQSTIVYRPWGRYEILASSQNHQIKKVTVKPGKMISLQKHFKRAEHWVVVSGVATVTCGNKVTKITKNESTYIPVEELHRLENNEQELLELIEVQTGDYFGEDDIERFDDEYGRV